MAHLGKCFVKRLYCGCGNLNALLSVYLELGECFELTRKWLILSETCSHIYLNINQLDALNFISSLFHASTCFEHKCQNCIIQSLVSSHL